MIFRLRLIISVYKRLNWNTEIFGCHQPICVPSIVFRSEEYAGESPRRCPSRPLYTGCCRQGGNITGLANFQTQGSRRRRHSKSQKLVVWSLYIVAYFGYFYIFKFYYFKLRVYDNSLSCIASPVGPKQVLTNTKVAKTTVNIAGYNIVILS